MLAYLLARYANETSSASTRVWSKNLLANNPPGVDIQELSTKCHYLINLFANSVYVYVFADSAYEEA